jgi:succinylglutamate desuccinylase
MSRSGRQPIKRVAIVGGTHGNELTGVYLVKKFQQYPEQLKRPSLECVALLGNPAAIAANRRYIDRDLNRCFADTDLANPALSTGEDRRAKAIAAQIGPAANPKVDLIIDLHSTTANMGLTLLPSSQHPFNLRLMAYLVGANPDVRIGYGGYGNQDDQPPVLLRSLLPLGCTIEVGPIAQGVVDAVLLQQTEILIHQILDYLDAYNQDKTLAIPSSITVHQAIQPISAIDYPRNADGEIQAAIHPDRQFRDYEPLHPGDPMFLNLMTGEAILYEGDRVVYPIFINEAAYYEKNIAMVFTEKKIIDLIS